MDVQLIFEFGVEWIWIQLYGVAWNRGRKSAPLRPLGATPNSHPCGLCTSKCMHGMNQTEAEYSKHGMRSIRASLSQIGPVVWRYNQISIVHAHNRSRDLSYKFIMVPKQCPLLRSTFSYLICCATCFGSRDNSKYRTYPLTEPPTNLCTSYTWPRSDFHRLFDSGFAPSALSIRLNSGWHWHDSVGVNAVWRFC